jgi:hypothetical protein
VLGRVAVSEGDLEAKWGNIAGEIEPNSVITIIWRLDH